MIRERVILLGVEHFEQRSRRIATEIDAYLVDLVEHEERVHRRRSAHGLDYAPRHCADVGPAMPTNLCLVAQSTKRDPHELASERLGNRTA